MKSLNRAQLKGNIGQVRINTVESRRVANFTLATDASWKDKNGEWHNDTDWHNVVAWEGFGIASLDALATGTKVSVTGKLKTRKYVGSDNIERYVTEVLAEDLDIISDNRQGSEVEQTGAPSPSRTPRATQSSSRHDTDDDF